MTASDFEIFLATAPGHEGMLAGEVRALHFKGVKAAPGGVTITGGWSEVWRANLWVRGASRISARIGSFRASHLSELDKRARKFAWAAVLRADQPVRVEAQCKASKIYHTGAAAERIAKAIHASLGAAISDGAEVTVRARIEKDVCTLSVDTSGELLHKRGFKEAVNAAPMRETMATNFLRQCGYDGRETVVDPMCGSGTFVIEAAEIAAGLAPGRSRSFAFEKLATFDAVAWQAMRASLPPVMVPQIKMYGSDRDPGAIRMSRANAARAGVADGVSFEQRDVSEIAAPPGPPGLVIVNPPYGDRLGETAKLAPLYRAFGQVLPVRFKGWRVGLITTDAALAKATLLPFGPPSAPVSHGGLRVSLYQCGPLP
jgi:putative N6-adenine-specific DNA methylase